MIKEDLKRLEAFRCDKCNKKLAEIKIQQGTLEIVCPRCRELNKKQSA